MPSKKHEIFSLTLASLKENRFFASPLHILILVIYTALIVFTIKYLNDLEKCECFNTEEYKSNITFLKVFEVLMLVGIAITIYFIYRIKIQKGGNNSVFGVILGIVIYGAYIKMYTRIVNVPINGNNILPIIKELVVHLY